jgi:hypothetical protein
MRRRQFIAGLAGAAAWPVVGRAQQGDRVRRIGLLLGTDENNVGKLRLPAFTQALADLGWIVGRNLRMDVRSLPIRFLPTPPRCRVLPGTGVKLRIGRCGNAARDAE